MLKNINPTQTQAWKALTAHFESAQDMDLKALFAQDSERFAKYSARFGQDILVDYSKNLVNAETMQHLFALAKKRICNLPSPRCLKVKRSTKRKIVRYCTLRCVIVAIHLCW